MCVHVYVCVCVCVRVKVCMCVPVCVYITDLQTDSEVILVQTIISVQATERRKFGNAVGE